MLSRGFPAELLSCECLLYLLTARMIATMDERRLNSIFHLTHSVDPLIPMIAYRLLASTLDHPMPTACNSIGVLNS